MASGIGDNSNTRRLASMSQTAQKLLRLRRELKEINGHIKEAKKLASLEGFSAAKIDHFVSLIECEDKQKPVARHASEKENLIWAGLIPDDRQGDLLTDRVTKEQLIWNKGYLLGMLQGDRVSGYDAASADDKMWLTGYDKGSSDFKSQSDEIAKEKAAKEAAKEPDGIDDLPEDV